MSAEQILRDIEALLEAAKNQAAEKRTHFRAARPLVKEGKGYEVFCLAAIGYASAADRLEELHDQFEDAHAEAQAEQLRRERDQQPELKGLVESPIGYYVSEEDRDKFDRLLTDPFGRAS